MLRDLRVYAMPEMWEMVEEKTLEEGKMSKAHDALKEQHIAEQDIEIARLRKTLEEIQIEVRKPEKFPRDMEKWLKRADKRTKLKKIFDIAAEALKDT